MMTTIEKATNYRDEIIYCLSSEKLPTGDLPLSLDNFFVAVQKQQVVGVAGLEVYSNYGLLRSLMVNPLYRNKNIAMQLITYLENVAKDKSVTEIYLLTETAQQYFTKKGYRKVSRATVPKEIQQSSEFSHVCPQSAIVMKKSINNQ